MELLLLDRLTDDESALFSKLRDRLSAFQMGNEQKAAYYEGKSRLKDLGIALPPSMRSMEVVVGWPGTAVDVLEERLDWEGWATPQSEDGFGLSEVYYANDLDVESSMAHLDSLIYGTSFVAVSSGDESMGEPEVLVTVESPRDMTAILNSRTRRVESALSVQRDEMGKIEYATMFTENTTVAISCQDGQFYVTGRDDHNLGRVPVVRQVNRPRSGDIDGRSEISRAVRYYTDAAARTVIGSELSREFYAAPQRWMMGAPESFFLDESGNAKPAWESYLGRILAVERDEDGEVPTVGQFAAGSPEPYINQVRSFSQLLSAEAAIPPTYLGFATDQAASADAIRAMESRLVKRAERRQKMFGRGWTEVARLAVMFRDGKENVPEDFTSVRPLWRDPSTPTRAAAADEVVKMISAGVYPPDSKVTYNRLGLSETDQNQLIEDKKRASMDAVLAKLREIGPQAPAPAQADPAVERLANRNTPVSEG